MAPSDAGCAIAAREARPKLRPTFSLVSSSFSGWRSKQTDVGRRFWADAPTSAAESQSTGFANAIPAFFVDAWDVIERAGPLWMSGPPESFWRAQGT